MFASACPSQPGSLADVTDPCDGTAVQTLVGSVVAPSAITKLVSEQAFLTLQFAAATVPDFWHLEPGGCRYGGMNMGTGTAGFSTAVCASYWGTSATGGWNYVPGSGGADRALLQAQFSLGRTAAGALAGGTEYYMFRVDIDDATGYDAQTGTYLCGGCQTAGCITFDRLILTDNPTVGSFVDHTITNAATRSFVTWQGGPGSGCPNAVPARVPSWGRVKSLYR